MRSIRSSVMRRKEAKKDEGADMKRCRVEKQKMERVVFLEFICQHHQFWQLDSAYLHCRTMCLRQAPVIEKVADGTFEAMTQGRD